MYDFTKKKVILSCDVVFNVQKFGHDDIGQETESQSQSMYTLIALIQIVTLWKNVRQIQQKKVLQIPKKKFLPIMMLHLLCTPSHSQRQKRKPDRYGFSCNLTTIEEPVSVKDALMQKEWIGAMSSEMDSLYDNDVWNLVELPKGQKVVGSKWVFKLKRNEDGSVERCKARLVAQGYSQEKGHNYDETFSPVVRSESIRSVIALASKNELKMHQLDVTTAFLNGELEEEVYVKQPEGFVVESQEHLVCKLKRSLYGTQSPRCWNQTLHTQLMEMGFKQTPSDPCIYTSLSDGLCVLAVYVDDILIAGKCSKKNAQVKAALARRFRVKDLGELHYFLGVSIKQNFNESGYTWMCQPAYIQNVLNKFGFEQCKSVNTPVASGTKLLKATDESELTDATLYQSSVGSLLYLSGWTRPDIAFAVSNVARFCSRPTVEHWIAVKRIFRHLKGTSEYGLVCFNNKDENILSAHSDADGAGDLNDRKSTSGYISMLSGGAVS